MGWRQRLMNKIIDKVTGYAKDDLEIGNIRQEANRPGGKKILLRLLDMDYERGFRVEDDQLATYPGFNDPDIICTTDSGTIRDVLKGEAVVEHPDRPDETIDYSLKRAWLYDRLKIEGGQGILSDIQLFQSIFQKVKEEINLDL